MRWAASSSDESVATARIVGFELVVEPELASEGTAQVTLTATDAFDIKATVRFEVQVAHLDAYGDSVLATRW